MGNGAILLNNPDSPVNVEENVPNRAPNSVALKWSPGLNSGGAPITDYRISMAQGDDNYSVIEQNAFAVVYEATGLTAGLSYKFKIEAHNGAYYSSPSAPVEILCAAIPDIPVVPTTANQDSVIYIDWTAPNDNGLPITSYTILTLRNDGAFV